MISEAKFRDIWQENLDFINDKIFEQGLELYDGPDDTIDSRYTFLLERGAEHYIKLIDKFGGIIVPDSSNVTPNSTTSIANTIKTTISTPEEAPKPTNENIMKHIQKVIKGHIKVRPPGHRTDGENSKKKLKEVKV
ncbi:unnamed protein product [Lepeophtheirus salmonis]|uniref:(salmon louse) hypothetical protein n=1 Tax=Lepeophtheirus salmonis TaxID=72036 RepID=A0A7R8CVP5_LEPSM|nr:unnamed protein product [Lepeophtheirus salmonis]CAF2946487.1 unnamed protein product [Lepeophtheirus salmonis]